jgi:hypothetical protein
MSSSIEAERRELLAKTLESGEYKQGQHQLRPTDDTYCCLGVACDIYRRETNDGIWQERTRCWEFLAQEDDPQGEIGILPTRVQGWYGFRCESGDFMHPISYAHTNLTSMNDSGEPFSEIAKVIREEPAGLVKEG